MNQCPAQSPIFVGGTGRSGTSIFSIILEKHPEVFTTSHELKLIVEPFGLLGLAHYLTDRWGPADGHHAVKNFIFFSQQIRRRGYLHPILRRIAKALGPNHERAILKWLPACRYSAHGIAHRFGIEHYDACIERLREKLIYHTDTSSPVQSYGVVNPYYITHKFLRPDLISKFRTFLDELYAKPLTAQGKSRWCDDTPRNVNHVDFLLEIYPRMKFIHMIRDPRDVVASYCKQSWASDSIDVNIHVIRNTIQGWQQLRARLPGDCYREVRLEDLVESPAKTLQAVCEFLELDFTPQLLAVDLGGSHHGRYKEELEPAHIEKINIELRDWMEEKGYHFATTSAAGGELRRAG